MENQNGNQNQNKAVEKTKLQVISGELRKESFLAAYDQTLPTTMKRFMPLDRAVNILMRAMQKNVKLMNSDLRSLKQCLLDSAALGLELAGPLHHAHVVPYYDKHSGKTICQLQIGFQGYLELARRTGEIDGAPIVQWVYEHDIFKINFASHQSPIIHEPCIDKPRGTPKLVYCLTWFKSGGYHFDFMTKTDIEAHRDLYAKKSKDGQLPSTWIEHFLEMGKKTIIKRAAKHWPLSSEFAEALELEDSADRGEKATLVEFAKDGDPVESPEQEQPAENNTRADEVLNHLQKGKSEQKKKVEVEDRTKTAAPAKEEEPPAVDPVTGEVLPAGEVPTSDAAELPDEGQSRRGPRTKRGQEG